MPFVHGALPSDPDYVCTATWFQGRSQDPKNASVERQHARLVQSEAGPVELPVGQRVVWFAIEKVEPSKVAVGTGFSNYAGHIPPGAAVARPLKLLAKSKDWHQ